MHYVISVCSHVCYFHSSFASSDLFSRPSPLNFMTILLAVVSDGNEIGAPSESAPCPENFPSNGSEWVELLVNEMTTASNMDDAKSRATRVLEAFEKAVVSHVNAQGPHDFQKVVGISSC